MKHKINLPFWVATVVVVLGLAVSGFAVPAAVNAEDDDGDGTRLQTREVEGTPERVRELNQDNDDADEDRQERLEEQKRQMLEARLKTVKRLALSQYNRLERMLDRLSNILDRIESRRDKLAETEADLARVDELIAEAEEQETAAAAALAKIKELPNTVETAPDAKRQVQAFMTTVNDLKKQLIALHRIEKEIIKEMRNAIRALEVSDDSDQSDSSDEEND